MVHSSRRSSSGAHPATYASLRCLRASLGLVICHSHPPLFPSLFFAYVYSAALQLLRLLFVGQSKQLLLYFILTLALGLLYFILTLALGLLYFILTLALGLLITLTVYTVECLVVWGLALLIAAAAG